MKSLKSAVLLCLLAALVLSVESANAARKAAPAKVTLSQEGERLKTKYAESLALLSAEIARSLPKIDGQKIAAYRKAYADEAAAQLAYEATYKGKSHIAVDAKAKEEAAKAGKEKAEAYAAAQARTVAAAKPIFARLEKVLSNEAVDAVLVKCAVLANATPDGLAEFAQQGKSEEALVAKLLGDVELMKQMLIAGGAKGGHFGRAMQIYTEILKASPKAGEGILQWLALGTSLEQAAPGAKSDQFKIDPVKRYLSYEKACLAGELDPAFKTMTAWDCRMITDEPHSEEDLAWCREMLRNYRPDHVMESDYRWRYSRIVKTDVPYRSPLPEQSDGTSRIQQLLCGGGKCGPRAFVGRIALRSFGIPTWGVQQPGHAALGHWTPSGWTINLGADWKFSTWEGRPGTDFHLESQARAYPKEYLKVLRAQWIGDALGEQKVDPAKPGTGDLWNALALTQKETIVAEAKPVTVALAGEDLAEATESKKAEAIVSAKITDADKRIAISPDGIITVPSAACSKPQNNTKGIVFMKSLAGGMQLSAGKDESFEYAFQVPASGKYELTARVCTVHKDQKLNLDAGGGRTPVSIPLPYTIGKWQPTKPVTVMLSKGMNTLHFAGEKDSLSFSIKDFTLKPAT